MARKPECIAMLLAGGQGSRLGILTKNIAKPAVPYGGKYRIIDAVPSAGAQQLYRLRPAVGSRQRKRRRTYPLTLSADKGHRMV